MDKEELSYFAYGNNMSTGQMERRDVEIKGYKVGTIPGWKIAFTRHSTEWKGGVIDLLPGEEDDWVEGIIYTVDPSELSTLDGYESRVVKRHMEIGLYSRVYFPVKTESRWKTVVTYMVNRTVEYREKTHVIPSKRYMDLILAGAKEHGLSEEYISKLKGWSKIF
ncbi:MAG: gamma-glutamylcyclotransferase [Thermoplasmata archaeon]